MRERFRIGGVEYTLTGYRVLDWPARAKLRKEAIDSLVFLNRSSAWDQRSSSFRYPYEVDDLMMEWERTVETPSELLGRLLATMDWEFNYSDDHTVWSRSCQQLERIRALTVRLGEAEAKPIWDKYAPDKFETKGRWS